MNARIRKKQLKQYAKIFCDEVRQLSPEVKEKLTRKNPIVKCYKEKGLGGPVSDYPDSVGGLEEIIETHNGRLVIDGYFDKETGSIEIYNIFGEPLDYIKTIIRHECIHFILYESGLPWKDNDEMFTEMARYFNANPYRDYTEFVDILKEIEII